MRIRGSAFPFVRDGANAVGVRNGTNAQTFSVYNTYTAGTPDYERLELFWSSNVAIIRVGTSGTGTARTLSLRNGDNTTAITMPAAGTSPIDFYASVNSATANARTRLGAGSAATATSGTHSSLLISESYAPTATSTMVARGIAIAPTVNYSAGTPGAGSYEALKIAVTETALPTGSNYLIRASAGSAGTTDRFSVTSAGLMALGADNGGALSIGYAAESHTLSAAQKSSTTSLIPAGAMVLAVTTRVTTAITAASGSTFDLVVTSGDTGVVASGVYTVDTTTVSPGPESRYVAPTTTGFTFINRGGAFTGGVVRVQVWYCQATAPTS